MDNELKKALLKEKKRQSENIELIASENYTSKYVRDFMVNAALNWLDNYHCDGLRMDMTKYMESDITMKEIAAEVNYHKPNAFLIAEDSRSNININSNGHYWYDANQIHDLRVTNPLRDYENSQNLDEDTHARMISEIEDNRTSLARLGYDSEWDFPFYHELNNAIYNNMNMDRLINAIIESGNRIKYASSHDEQGNFEGTALIQKLMVPMLNLNDNIDLDEKDLDRVEQYMKLKNCSQDFAKTIITYQKAQFAAQALSKALLTGELDGYKNNSKTFNKDILEPLGIKSSSNITPQKVKIMYMVSFNKVKSVLSQVYAAQGPVMVFQGDEKTDITPFKFFREFESIKNEDYLYTEKGYEYGKAAFEDSKMGNINYSEFATTQMNSYKQLTKDLNNITQENPALTQGVYIEENIIKHPQSKVYALHLKDDESQNEIYNIANFNNPSYPSSDADCYYIDFPKGVWQEILNTDDKKYGGKGYTNSKPIISNGYDKLPIKLAGNSTILFKRIS